MFYPNILFTPIHIPILDVNLEQKVKIVEILATKMPVT